MWCAEYQDVESDSGCCRGVVAEIRRDEMKRLCVDL